MLLLISYDLDASARPGGYEKLKQAIETKAIAFEHPLYSQWLVETNDDVDAWTSHLTPFLTQEDRLLVVRVLGRSNGYLPPGLWTWINARAT